MTDAAQRSQTWLRLTAVAAVMAGCLSGAIGLSAVGRYLETAPSDVAVGASPEAPAGPLQGPPPMSSAPSASSTDDELTAAEAERAAREQEAPGAVAPPSAGSPAPSSPSQPNYGGVSLSTGFTPDPYVVNVRAGGGRDTSTLASACSGYIAQAPDFSFDYVAGRSPLIISVDSQSDTTLVVRAPNGAWQCDDDSGGALNPRIRFERPQSGRYTIWVGTFTEGASVPSRLSISEVE